MGDKQLSPQLLHSRNLLRFRMELHCKPHSPRIGKRAHLLVSSSSRNPLHHAAYNAHTHGQHGPGTLQKHSSNTEASTWSIHSWIYLAPASGAHPMECRLYIEACCDDASSSATRTRTATKARKRRRNLLEVLQGPRQHKQIQGGQSRRDKRKGLMVQGCSPGKLAPSLPWGCFAVLETITASNLSNHSITIGKMPLAEMIHGNMNAEPPQHV